MNYDPQEGSDEEMRSYESLVDDIRDVEITWLPGVLAVTLETAICKSAFKDRDQLLEFVRMIVDRQYEKTIDDEPIVLETIVSQTYTCNGAVDKCERERFGMCQWHEDREQCE